MSRPNRSDEAPAAAAGDSTYDPRSGPTVELPVTLVGAFGRYVIEREIGAGGMGTVYLARDPHLNRSIALKVPKPGMADDETFLRRFYREARSAAAVTHPNVCPVYEVGECDGTHFIAMGYVEGRPLTAYVDEQKPLSARQAAIVVRKVALALQEAHERGLVHRDLKPGNVMIDRRGEPVVMDFGLARPVERDADMRLTQDGQAAGTVAYMPPEQFAGDESLLGPATDVYALGVTMFELLTGRLPYAGRGTITSVVSEVMTKPVPSPRDVRPDVPPELAAVCIRAMAKRPEERFASMKAMADELTRYLKSSGPQAASAGGPMAPATAAAATASRGSGVGRATAPKAAGGRSRVKVVATAIGLVAAGGLIVGVVAWATSRPPAGGTPEEQGQGAAATNDEDPVDPGDGTSPVAEPGVGTGFVPSDVPFAQPVQVGPVPSDVPFAPPPPRDARQPPGGRPEFQGGPPPQ
jgi:serine/threonine-protein kinase